MSHVSSFCMSRVGVMMVDKSTQFPDDAPDGVSIDFSEESVPWNSIPLGVWYRVVGQAVLEGPEYREDRVLRLERPDGFVFNALSTGCVTQDIDDLRADRLVRVEELLGASLYLKSVRKRTSSGNIARYARLKYD